MSNSAQKHIFFVDDEPKVREAVYDTLVEFGAKVTCFSSAEDCLQEIARKNFDLLITDVNMSGMNGIELLIQAKKIRPLLPVLVLTGFGDVTLAVRVMKEGAVDFVEKPLDETTFLTAVKAAMERDTFDPIVGQKLTKREIEIVQYILSGKSNKEIASLLYRSIKTVEFHRYRLMRKLNAHNLADLIKRVAAMDL